MKRKRSSMSVISTVVTFTMFGLGSPLESYDSFPGFLTLAV